MEQKGVITVYLSLSLFIMLSLITTMVESARFNMARSRAAMVMDMGMDSIFAEYNRELLDHYDLYFIDTSYGGERGSTHSTEEHLRDFIKRNLEAQKKVPLPGLVDYAGLNVEDAVIDAVSFATDDGGRVFKRQAIHAVRDRFGLSIIDDVKERIKKYEESEVEDAEIDKRREEIYKELKGIDLDQEDCPVEKVFDKRPGILNLILEKEGSVSEKELKLENTASHRKNETGMGVIKPSENPDSMKNELLFDEYLLWKFSCYTEELGHEDCSYELEYVLNGKNTDIANLRDTVSKLLFIREAADTIAALSDENKKNQAKPVALVVSLLVGQPEIEDALTELILFAWGFAEAVIDVRTLLSGGRIPLMKGEGDWRLRKIVELPFFLTYGPAPKTSNGGLSEGFSYKDYLRIFLFAEDKTDKVMRSIDAVEMYLRTTDGNQYYRADASVDYLQADTVFSGSGGYEFDIRREYAYEPVAE